MSLHHDISGFSFLIIDDSAHMRSIIRTMLSGFGVKKIVESADAIKAYELFKSEPIDIIIVDLKMTRLDGNEFAKLVRTDKDSPNPFVPIIMLTAYGERRTVELARDCGVNELLGKPVSARDLYLRVVETLTNPREFVSCSGFFGPDRRRFTSNGYKGPERRRNIVKV